MKTHYAMMGVGIVQGEYPLYYDAVNEKGLAMAGLNFVRSACFGEVQPGQDNVAQFELLPWILGQCADVAEAKALLGKIHLTNEGIAPGMPPAHLHWILADEQETVVLEVMEDGVHIYPDPVGVLTNEPPFPLQMFRLNEYMGLTSGMAENRLSKELPLQAYSRGMGALGLPGDLSSQSRFARAAFMKLHAACGETEAERVGQFFHLLDTVKMVRGCCQVETGEEEYTVYQSCYHAREGICYYTAYENRRVHAVELRRENLDGEVLISYPMIRETEFIIQN